MNINKVKVSELKPALYNPRKDLKPSDREYQKIKKSIEEFGYVDPIIANKDMTIIGGHQRFKVLKDLGYSDIECVIVDLDKEKEKALNIALNKISGEWDMVQLADLLEELKDSSLDVELTGFDYNEIEKIMNQHQDKDIQEDDFDVDEAMPETPISRRGDVWLLGRHRLMCGDSTYIDDVEKLMDGKKANLVVTDPPYNVNYEGATKDKLKIKNDNMDNDSFYQFLFDVYTNLYLVSDDGAGIYVFHADTEGINFRKAMIDAGWKLAQCCIWVKQSMVMGRQDYHWQHEPVLYGWKPTGGHQWYSDRKQTTVWKFDRPSKNDIHPTMKPVELIAYPIQNNSLSNSIVVDLFGGSGSTLIASEQTNRICHTMELDEKYVDVIIKRYIQFKGSDEDVYLVRDDEKIVYRNVVKNEQIA